ncbi:MAG TPA: hypothetical protein VG432_12220, partial [Gemmatimonadaceae bacterium]|nr:hypothetical protein [Gemmatimonadaceae bacterium]
MSHRLVTQLVAAATLLCGRAAGAQYVSAAGLHRAATALTAQRVVDPSAAMVARSRVRGAARGALIGTAVGAAVGLVIVAATPH